MENNNNQDNNKKFVVQGLPSNDPLPEEEHKSGAGGLSMFPLRPDMNLEQSLTNIANMFSKLTDPNDPTTTNISEADMKKLVNEMMKDPNIKKIVCNISDAGNDIAQMLNDLFNDNGSNNGGEATDEQSYDDDEDVHSDYALGNVKYLKPQWFGAIECVRDPDIYNKYLERMAQNDEQKKEQFPIDKFILSDLTKKLPIQSIKKLEYVTSTDLYILFYADFNDDDNNQYGFYIALIEEEPGKFSAFIPEFRNTFYVDEETGEVDLYDPDQDPNQFDVDSTGTVSFLNLNISAIEFAIRFSLVPKNHVLISPHQFGTIKNIIPAIREDARFVRIGTITSNESPEAILLKKDADLNLDETSFPLYADFGRVIDKASLNMFMSTLFKVDLNACKLLDNVELKYTSGHTLYIDIDIGNF